MKGGMQAALGLGVGYMLSRCRKMRLAAIMAATAAGGLGGLAVKRATKVLWSTDAPGTFAPQLVELADVLHPDEIEGWRGVIEDGEVVQDHEEAIAEQDHGGGEPEDRTDAELADEEDSDDQLDDLDPEGIEDTTKKPATKTRTRGPAQGTKPLNRNMTKAGSAPARLGAGPRAASRGPGGSGAARSACSAQSVGRPGRAGGNSQ